jgi:uncharacterized protein YprB with RNaseH-like and TPR domain
LYSTRLREGLAKLVGEKDPESAGEACARTEPGGRGRARAGVDQQKRAGELSSTPIGVDEYLPGGEVRTECGPVFVHECTLSGFKEGARELRRSYRVLESGLARPSWELGPALAAELAPIAGGALFLDLETTGLHGSVLFLAGHMTPIGDDFLVRQLFARDYSEEKALLVEARRALSSCEAIVTFNGKSYDVPFLKERGAYHRLDLSEATEKPHIDLLHWSRRKWKGEVSNCRLQTLEWEVCRQRRWGDVPGDQIPGIYHRYVRTGDPYQLVPVFHHNVLDLVTMVELLVKLLSR